MDWFTERTNSRWTYSFFAYYGLTSLTTCALLFARGRRTRSVVERRQSEIIVATAVVALVLGTFTNVVAPQLLPNAVPDLASVLAVIWSVGFYVAVTRYGMLSLTAQVAAEDILATMQDAVVLLDPAGLVATANDATLELLGYRPSELFGRRRSSSARGQGMPTPSGVC